MNPFLIGLPAFAVCLLAGYLLREFAIGKLSAEQLGSLDKSLRPTRIRFIVSTVAVSLVFFVVRYSVPRLATTWFEMVLFLTAAMTVGFEMVGWRICKRSGLPRSFEVPYFISRIISILGILCLIAAMAATPLFDFKTSGR